MQEQQQECTLRKIPSFDFFFLAFDFSSQFIVYQHDEFTSDGYKNLYISLSLFLLLIIPPIGKVENTHAKEGGKQNL